MSEKPSKLKSLESSVDTSPTVELHEMKISADKSSKQSTNSSMKYKIKLEPGDIDTLKPKKVIEISTSQTPTRAIKKTPEQQFIQQDDKKLKLKVNRTRKKKIIRKLMPDEITKSPASNNFRIKILFFGLVAVIAVILGSILVEFNEHHFDFTNASLELQEKIYGQNNAINQLSNHYRDIVETFDVVILIGGSGVGKSYSCKIIKKHFPNTYNIFEYSPPLENVRELAYGALSSHYCNLVIVENLKSNDLLDFVNFLKFLKNRKDHPCVIILAILNPEIVDDNLIRTLDLQESLNEINVAFSSVPDIPMKTIIFDPLTPDIIDICIKDEAQKSHIRLTDEQLLEVKRHLLLTNSGCKGAYAKVQLYAKP